MKRPRIALCLLMTLLATSLYAVGFAADRENLGGSYSDADWGTDEADLCQYAYEGYCEFAYDRPAAADLYDGCTAGDEDLSSTADDLDYQAFAPDIDELEAPALDDEEIGLSDEENASIESAAVDYENEYAYENEYSYENESGYESDYAYENQPGYENDYAYESEPGYESEYAEDLAENPEPQDFDRATWCRRYCLAREAEIPVAQTLPAGTIRNFVQQVSDSLVQLLDESRCDGDAAWRPAAAEGLIGIQGLQIRLPLAAGPGLLNSFEWSAANSALAAGANRWVVVESLPLPAANLEMLVGPPQPVTLRDLVRPLARLAVGVRKHWQQAWSEMSDLAAEGNEVPEVSSRPQSESVDPPICRCAMARKPNTSQ